jgi:hypothetical protein
MKDQVRRSRVFNELVWSFEPVKNLHFSYLIDSRHRFLLFGIVLLIMSSAFVLTGESFERRRTCPLEREIGVETLKRGCDGNLLGTQAAEIALGGLSVASAGCQHPGKSSGDVVL